MYQKLIAEHELQPELDTYESYGGDLLPHKLPTNQTNWKKGLFILYQETSTIFIILFDTNLICIAGDFIACGSCKWRYVCRQAGSMF